MGFTDHIAVIKRIYKRSVLESVISLIVFCYSGVAFAIPRIFPQYEEWPNGMIATLLAHWERSIILTMALVIHILYRQLLPTVEIAFDETGRYRRKNGNNTEYLVDLINHGEWQDEISFCIESIMDSNGEYYPINRMGLEREASKGPVPLSPNSPKFGYIASMDETKPDSKIEIKTISDKDSGYQPAPIFLERGTYYIEARLSPRKGQPHRKRFKIYISPNNELRMNIA